MLISIVYIGINYITGSPNLNFHWPTWVIPLLSLFGIFIAAYLSYVEVSSAEAVCGPVGDCNTVQESPYAFLFGTIPIGIIGILGYIAILITWIFQSLVSSFIKKICTMLIWLMAWGGVLFSIYLTFLEPFVIGATCIWCISSAIIMTLILWAATPPVIREWQFNDDDYEEFPESEVLH